MTWDYEPLDSDQVQDLMARGLDRYLAYMKKRKAELASSGHPNPFAQAKLDWKVYKKSLPALDVYDNYIDD